MLARNVLGLHDYSAIFMLLRAIDLFCGAGGSSIGARNAGAQIVAGFDIWAPAVRTYAKNFPEARVYDGDIRQLGPENIWYQIGDINLLLASPECTNHSVAKGAAAKDEESRLTAFQVHRFAEVFLPEWIVVENVIQMKQWTRHEELLNQLRDLGYKLQQLTFNAQDFSVPQSRKRLFLLGSRSCEPDVQSPDYREPTPASTILDRTGKYRLSPLHKPGRALATLKRADRAIEALGPNEPFIIVYYGTDGGGGWQRIDRPLRTITTLDRFAYVEPSNCGHLMRMLQPEELKRAMGYEQSFMIDMPELSRRDRIKLMGNGVCPPVMEHIVKTLTGPR